MELCDRKVHRFEVDALKTFVKFLDLVDVIFLDWFVPLLIII
jgi:predicted XRE-type DNA-binding protein